jgi:hypothetical protein
MLFWTMEVPGERIMRLAMPKNRFDLWIVDLESGSFYRVVRNRSRRRCKRKAREWRRLGITRTALFLTASCESFGSPLRLL